MGFVVLLSVGAVLGWTASILARTDDRRGILMNIGAGIVGAFVGGALASRDSLLIGLSAIALVAAIGGAVLVLAGLNFARLRMAE